MKKRIYTILIALACLLILAGCGCEHEWVEADCDSPMTCALCEETEGAPLGHSWMAATCDAPKTCENCGETEGEAKGHFWEEATCTQAKTCNVCKSTEGEALGHTWEEATTELPKTCSVCQLTEGEKLDVDPRFTTAATKEIQGRWSANATIPAEELGMEDLIDQLDCTLFYEFGNDGVGKMSMEAEDYHAFIEVSRQFGIDAMYAEFAAMGIGQNEANELMKQTYGMTIEEMVDASLAEVDLEEYFAEFYVEFVYYVEDGEIYISEFGWEAEFDSSAFAIEDGKLIIEDDTLFDGGEPLVWTRVEE